MKQENMQKTEAGRCREWQMNAGNKSCRSTQKCRAVGWRNLKYGLDVKPNSFQSSSCVCHPKTRRRQASATVIDFSCTCTRVLQEYVNADAAKFTKSMWNMLQHRSWGLRKMSLSSLGLVRACGYVRVGACVCKWYWGGKSVSIIHRQHPVCPTPKVEHLPPQLSMTARTNFVTWQQK